MWRIAPVMLFQQSRILRQNLPFFLHKENWALSKIKNQIKIKYVISKNKIESNQMLYYQLESKIIVKKTISPLCVLKPSKADLKENEYHHFCVL